MAEHQHTEGVLGAIEYLRARIKELNLKRLQVTAALDAEIGECKEAIQRLESIGVEQSVDEENGELTEAKVKTNAPVGIAPILSSPFRAWFGNDVPETFQAAMAIFSSQKFKLPGGQGEIDYDADLAAGDQGYIYRALVSLHSKLLLIQEGKAVASSQLIKLFAGERSSLTQLLSTLKRWSIPSE